MRTSGQCEICKAGAEDIRHMLFECSHAKAIWRELGLHEIIEQARTIDRLGSTMIEWVLQEEKHKSVYMEPMIISDIFSVTCWYL